MSIGIFLAGVAIGVGLVALWAFWDYKRALWLNDEWDDIQPRKQRSDKGKKRGTYTRHSPTTTVKVKK